MLLLEKAAKDSREGRKPQFPLMAWHLHKLELIPLKEEFYEFSDNLC